MILDGHKREDMARPRLRTLPSAPEHVSRNMASCAIAPMLHARLAFKEMCIA